MNTQFNRFQTQFNPQEDETPPLPFVLANDELNSIFSNTTKQLKLGNKVKAALQPDHDAEESLAAIRAILVGPSRRLHEARMEELISILEESDRASEAAIQILDERCDTLDSDLRLSVEKLKDEMAELFRAIDSKFEHFKIQIDEQLDQKQQHTSSTIENLEGDFKLRLQEQDEKITTTFDALTKQFEDRFLGQDEHVEKVQLHSAEVFAQGFSDIAKRLLSLRRAYVG